MRSGNFRLKTRAGRLILLGLLLLLLVQLLTACEEATPVPGANGTGGNKGSTPTVVIGSMLFTENIVTAEIYAQALENVGIPVQRKFNFGPTDKLEPATLRGEVSLYPEYTGNALEVILHTPRTSNNPQAVYDQVVRGYGNLNLQVLDPAPMNDTYALAVSKSTASTYHLKTLSDLAPLANQLNLVSVMEWDVTRADRDGIRALQKTYGGFNFKNITEVAEDDRYKAFTQGKGEVVLAYTTDGEIAGYNLVLLDDDKQFFPPYQLIPVIRPDIVKAYPNIKPILNNISMRLTTEKITSMNWKVNGPDRSSYAMVAKNFLTSEGLL